MPDTSLVVLGRIIKPHGIKGELRVDYYAESTDLLEKPLMLRAGRFSLRPVHICSRRFWKDQLILSIEGCSDRSMAEQLRGQELIIDASFLPAPEDDEPYLCEIVGLSVYLEDGSLVGILEDASYPAGQEMWTIRAPQESGGYEILFPAVPEFVRNIDLKAKAITIAPPEGLLELYREQAADMPSNEPDGECAQAQNCAYSQA